MIVLFRFQTVVRINASFLQGRRHKISAAGDSEHGYIKRPFDGATLATTRGADSGAYLPQNFRL
jgi:hypothetical protein